MFYAIMNNWRFICASETTRMSRYGPARSRQMVFCCRQWACTTAWWKHNLPICLLDKTKTRDNWHKLKRNSGKVVFRGGVLQGQLERACTGLGITRDREQFVAQHLVCAREIRVWPVGGGRNTSLQVALDKMKCFPSRACRADWVWLIEKKLYDFCNSFANSACAEC